jgi:hypothetical protein
MYVQCRNCWPMSFAVSDIYSECVEMRRRPHFFAPNHELFFGFMGLPLFDYLQLDLPIGIFLHAIAQIWSKSRLCTA